MMDDVFDLIRVLCRDITERDQAFIRYAKAFTDWQEQMRELAKEVHYADYAFGELAKALEDGNQ